MAKSLASISVQYKSHSGRVLSVLLNLCDNTKISIVTTYFPCFSNTCQYRVELSECLSDIEHVLSLCQDVVILGDTNFECNTHNEGYRSCQSLSLIHI